ncbi:MAG: DUF2085 domain-containing protein, partial [Anaerolineaceae bacterium]|nr:DUF2085 domain-containing protein [Anaerolineaceae bacterium]
FLAPAFMATGLAVPGKVIYWLYSFLCHQLPERSYFLFGAKISYTIPEIQAVWRETDNIAILRQFVGNTQMGWKVAWSDRMVSMFTSLWLFGIFWGVFKKRIKALPWWGFILLLLPMAVDGTTHLISDLAGIGQGFRDSNTWLASLTNNTFPTVFYAGDAWGSFNAWMRLISGVLFGLGSVWFGFPYLDEAFRNSAEVVEYKDQYRTWLQVEKERLLKLSLAPEPERSVQVVNVQNRDDETKSRE